MTSRRDFFKIIGAAAAVVVAPKAAAIWLPESHIALPEAKEIEVVREAIWDGRTMACYFFPRMPSQEMLADRFDDSADYFAPGTPVLALVSGHMRIGRYMFRGNRDALVAGSKASIAATWNVGEAQVAQVRHEWTTSTG